MIGVWFDFVKDMGFIGGKMLFYYGFVEGLDGFCKNIVMIVDMCEKCGVDFWLMFDCWMVFDVDYVSWFVIVVYEYGLKWIEEVISFDDYWGYVELKCNVFKGMFVMIGEYEVMCWGFCMLLEMECCDII